MGKQHSSDDNTGRRGRANQRPNGDFKKPADSRRPSGNQNNRSDGGSRFGDRSRGSSSFPSRPSFGRPGSFGGGRSSGGASREFGRDDRGGNNRGSFDRGANDRGPSDRRGSFDQRDDRRGQDYGQREERSSRPVKSYEPKANWSGQPYRREEGQPAVPRGMPGERNRKFQKQNPNESYRDERPESPRPRYAEDNNDFRSRPTNSAPDAERDQEMGPNRPIRPARPFDFRNPPVDFREDQDDRASRNDRDDRPARRDQDSRPPRNDRDDRPTRTDWNDRPARNDRDDRAPRNDRDDRLARRDQSSRDDRPARDDRERRDYSSDRKPRFPDRPAGGYDKPRPTSPAGGLTGKRDRPYGDQDSRAPRPVRSERPTDNRAGRPRPGEVPGEAPNYRNLKHYEEDKSRGNKRRRDEEPDSDQIRLNRYIANAGVCSRRDADALIAAGEIKVNGEVVTEMGYQVQPSDTVQYGKTNLNREKLVYVLLNKPKDFITTTDDPEGRRTVMDLVATASKERIFPVGRLDRNTTGLLLFTNDGEVAQKLSHPSHKNKKIYQVELDKPLTEADLKQIAQGVELEDGRAEIDDVAVVAGNAHFVGIELHTGRNRIVRRIFEHLGYDVVTLDRVQYAGLTKKELPRGKWRFLSEKEVIRLKYFM